MKLKLIFTACLTLGLTASACGNVDEDGGTSLPTANSQMALSADLLGGTDVAGFKFKLTRVNCKTGDTVHPYQEHKGYADLEEMFLPGGNETFEGGPKDEGYDQYSKHHFSDYLFEVPYGCYDVKAIPVDKHGDRSEDCAVAVKRNQKAIKQAFTETHLISQCRGEARRTSDVVASLNHPPQIDDLDIEKFMCSGAGVRVCATASDPDNDPLRFYWKGLDNGCFLPAPTGKPHYDPQTGKTTHCVTIPSRMAETKNYKVVVKDLAWSDDSYKRVPIEDLLAEQDNYHSDPYVNPDESRAERHFVTHSIDDCIPGAMSFIGLTLGADLDDPHDKWPNKYKGMSRTQAKKLAANAVDFVNPNGYNQQPDILIVQDDRTKGEDEFEAKFIEGLLKEAGFTDIVRIVEPHDGLSSWHLVGFDIVWFTNPGHPIDDEKTYIKLRRFRENGGGVIISGDDANRNVKLDSPLDMSYFSFMEHLDQLPKEIANGEKACYKPVDNWGQYAYKVELKPNTPLTKGIYDLKFPYANDIDRNKLLGKGEILAGYTEGLVGKPDCLKYKVPVITAVPSPLTLY